MSAKERAKEKVAEDPSGIELPHDNEPATDEGTDLAEYEPASARNIPRPHTSLTAAAKKDIGKLTVTLLGDISSAPVLAEVEKFNKKGEGEGEGRTPLMAVIQAVLAKSGGSMQLGELATQIRKYWHRPFPTSPYTDEELIYIIVRNSDSIRVS